VFVEPGHGANGNSKWQAPNLKQIPMNESSLIKNG
jgi:hypothetical protein